MTLTFKKTIKIAVVSLSLGLLGSAHADNRLFDQYATQLIQQIQYLYPIAHEAEMAQNPNARPFYHFHQWQSKDGMKPGLITLLKAIQASLKKQIQYNQTAQPILQPMKNDFI